MVGDPDPDLVTDLIRGHFRPQRPDLRSYPANAPFASGALLYGNRLEGIDWLIDTGADQTIVSPQDAFNLLGLDRYVEIMRQRPTLTISGIGASSAVQLDIQIHLYDLEGGFASFDHTAIVMNVAIDDSGNPLNWSMPSLLGRDIQEDFRLTIAHRPPDIELLRLDDI